MAFGGIYLIIACTPGAKFSFSSEAFLDNLLVLTGSILFALYAILAQPLLKHYTSLQLTTFAMGGGLILLVPCSCSKYSNGTFSTWRKNKLWSIVGRYNIFCGLLLIKLNTPQEMKDLTPVKQNKEKEKNQLIR